MAKFWKRSSIIGWVYTNDCIASFFSPCLFFSSSLIIQESSGGDLCCKRRFLRMQNAMYSDHHSNIAMLKKCQHRYWVINNWAVQWTYSTLDWRRSRFAISMCVKVYGANERGKEREEGSRKVRYDAFSRKRVLHKHLFSMHQEARRIALPNTSPRSVCGTSARFE